MFLNGIAVYQIQFRGYAFLRELMYILQLCNKWKNISFLDHTKSTHQPHNKKKKQISRALMKDVSFLNYHNCENLNN